MQVNYYINLSLKREYPVLRIKKLIKKRLQSINISIVCIKGLHTNDINLNLNLKKNSWG